jgi:hopanoid biosynthesis associated RND transporter like protein HpnN
MNDKNDFKDEVPFIPRILMGMVHLVARFPLFTVVVVGILVALSILAACTGLSFLTQRNDLVSPTKEHQQRWRLYVREFGEDDDMVVVVKGQNQPRMREALETLAKMVAARPDLFDRVFYKADLRPLRDRALLYMPVEEIRKIQSSIQDMKFLFEPPLIELADPYIAWKVMSLSQMYSEANSRAFYNRHQDRLSSRDREFFEQMTAITAMASATLDEPQNYRSPWKSFMAQNANQPDLLAEPQYFFSGDKTLAFFLTSPVQDRSSFTSSEKSIEEMRRLLETLREQYPDLEIGLTGLPVLEGDEMNASRSDTATASCIALIFVALLYLGVYRGVRYPFLTVSTLLVGTILALGWLTVTVGHLNILSATFAVMLIGLGDYGVLWVTRYEQERARGHDVLGALRLTAQHVGPGILTASVTTAAAFYSGMLADFRAVSELGWIAGSGVLLCGLSCFTFLPAMIRLMDRKEPVEKPIMPMPERTQWLPALTRHPRWVMVGIVFLVMIGTAFATRVRFNHNLLEMQAQGLESVQWELTLIEHTDGASWHAVSYTTTPEEARALKARFETLPCVSQVIEVASLIPLQQEIKMDAVRDIHKRLQKLPPRGQPIPHLLAPEPEQLDRQITELVKSLGQIGYNNPPEMVRQLQAKLGELQERLQVMPAEVSVQRLRVFENHVTEDLAENLHRLRDVSTPGSIRPQDIPQNLRERYIGKNGKWLLKVFPTESLWEYEPLQQFAGAIRQVDPEVTGKPFSTLEGLDAMRDGFKWACIYAFLAMVLILALDFRNVRHTLLALTPLAFGLVLTFGIMGMFGVPLNMANIIALPLLLGVGADNGVHILHDYLSRPDRRRYALGYSTGRGILVAALTTVFGFGTLMISRHQGLFSLGLVLAIGVSCCMLTALVFLPALLRLVPVKPTEETAKTPRGRKSKVA